MEKARQFLCIYDKSNDYNERLLSLYNGLYLLLKDEIWSKVQGIGIERERLEDALAYVRECRALSSTFSSLIPLGRKIGLVSRRAFSRFPSPSF